MPFNYGVLGDKFNKGGTVDLEKYEGIESISLGIRSWARRCPSRFFHRKKLAV